MTADDPSAALFEEGGGLVVDLTGVQEAKYELVPKGIYSGEIDSCEYKDSKAGAKMWETWIRITGEGDYVNRKLPYYFSFSAKALPFTKAALAKVAPELLQGKFNPQQIADEGTMLGKKVRFRVVIKEYEGEDRSNIGALLPAVEGTAGNGAAAGSSFL